MAPGKKLIPLLIPATLFLILFYLLVQLSRGIDTETGYSGNPIIDGWYADPEIIIFDSAYWIFPTFSAPFSEQVFMDAFSSPDLVSWTKHARIVDTAIISWADSAMWAPCSIEKEGKYYLFFAANDIQTSESNWFDPEKHAGMKGGIGIAVAEQPGGPYKDHLGEPLIGEVINGAQPIDQFVFQDAGAYYIVYGGWGRCNMGMLNEDFTTLRPFDDGDLVKEITPEGYVEGPVIFKKKGTWYMMWSEGGWTNASYRVAYGIAHEVTGPYIRQGVVLEKDTTIATGAGHHSIVKIPGTDDWYIAYHRRPIPNEGRDHRVTCIERLYFEEAGNILPVKMTREGVKRRNIRQ
ncbi:MAG: glycoside hydrolase family 43 protein [Bacteroidales bacterium]|nr:glycoside hydrolase family 43 protein [Bacteroidales bacterium]MDT8430766.1 glycoside hydrolase family 43 protein [Bacteroidales bacterium]